MGSGTSRQDRRQVLVVGAAVLATECADMLYSLQDRLHLLPDDLYGDIEAFFDTADRFADKLDALICDMNAPFDGEHLATVIKFPTKEVTHV